MAEINDFIPLLAQTFSGFLFNLDRHRKMIPKVNNDHRKDQRDRLESPCLGILVYKANDLLKQKCDDNDCDYQSAGEFASVLKENLTEEIKGNVKIGVGGVAHGASELPQYYAYAKSALINGAEYDPKSDIYSYKEYALIKALSELPEATKEKYVKTVLDRNYRDVTADEELMAAADAFLQYSLNISEASRNMYVHRNTLIYRLDKLEKLTGLNIRNFADAVTFRTACLIHKML